MNNFGTGEGGRDRREDNFEASVEAVGIAREPEGWKSTWGSIRRSWEGDVGVWGGIVWELDHMCTCVYTYIYVYTHI